MLISQNQVGPGCFHGCQRHFWIGTKLEDLGSSGEITYPCPLQSGLYSLHLTGLMPEVMLGGLHEPSISHFSFSLPLMQMFLKKSNIHSVF